MNTPFAEKGLTGDKGADALFSPSWKDVQNPQGGHGRCVTQIKRQSKCAKDGTKHMGRTIPEVGAKNQELPENAALSSFAAIRQRCASLGTFITLAADILKGD